MADLDRNAIPANADCRGGVFATRRFPRPSYSPYAKIPPPAAPAAQNRPRGDTLDGYGGAAPLIVPRCFESRRGTPRRYKRPLRILCLPRPPQKKCPA